MPKYLLSFGILLCCVLVYNCRMEMAKALIHFQCISNPIWYTKIFAQFSGVYVGSHLAKNAFVLRWKSEIDFICLACSNLCIHMHSEWEPTARASILSGVLAYVLCHAMPCHSMPNSVHINVLYANESTHTQVRAKYRRRTF